LAVGDFVAATYVLVTDLLSALKVIVATLVRKLESRKRPVVKVSRGVNFGH